MIDIAKARFGKRNDVQILEHRLKVESKSRRIGDKWLLSDTILENLPLLVSSLFSLKQWPRSLASRRILHFHKFGFALVAVKTQQMHEAICTRAGEQPIGRIILLNIPFLFTPLSPNPFPSRTSLIFARYSRPLHAAHTCISYLKLCSCSAPAHSVILSEKESQDGLPGLPPSWTRSAAVYSVLKVCRTWSAACRIIRPWPKYFDQKQGRSQHRAAQCVSTFMFHVSSELKVDGAIVICFGYLPFGNRGPVDCSRLPFSHFWGNLSNLILFHSFMSSPPSFHVW